MNKIESAFLTLPPSAVLKFYYEEIYLIYYFILQALYAKCTRTCARIVGLSLLSVDTSSISLHLVPTSTCRPSQHTLRTHRPSDTIRQWAYKFLAYIICKTQ